MDISKSSNFQYYNQLVIDKYLLFLASTQILLILVMIISFAYRTLFNKEIPIIERLREKKDKINFYFMLLTTILILYIFNPYINVSFVMSNTLKTVLFSAACIQLIFLFQQEPAIYKNFDAIQSIVA